MDGAFPSQKGESFDNGFGGRGGRGGRGFRGTAENAKTKLCTRWLQGDCRFGDRCNFAHGEHELRKGSEGEARSDGGGRGYPGGGRGGARSGFPTYPAGGRGAGSQQGGRGYGGRGGYPGGYGAQAGYPAYGMEGGGYAQPAPEATRGPAGPQKDEWAQQGYPVPGPNGWTMYRTTDSGEPYYHNHRTNQTIWDRPADWPMTGPMV